MISYVISFPLSHFPICPENVQNGAIDFVSAVLDYYSVCWSKKKTQEEKEKGPIEGLHPHKYLS
jgi:hypothetical protein